MDTLLFGISGLPLGNGSSEIPHILPNQFVLAMEYIVLPNNITALLRVEVRLEEWDYLQNAGWVDPGFKGEITLEL